jgi:hypothetical protein
VPTLKNIKQVLTKIELIVSNETKCIEIVDNNEDNCIISAIVNLLKKLSKFNNIYGYNPVITKYDIPSAVNIILNKTKIKIDTYKPDFAEFVTAKPPDFDLDDNINPEDKYEIVFEDEEDDDDKSEASEIDYIQEGDDQDENTEIDGAQYRNIGNRWNSIKANIAKDIENKERKRFEIYKNVNKIRLYLDANNIVSGDNSVIAEYIIDSIKIIKKFKMSPKIKTNRINFFASTL